ncbi:hypothetical protein B0T16DRAFT_248970 [Cercophora newfieldiana]|uniref:Ubiquitin-like domain-containing protein n=1 Tax=Cercophora newfieldiana TaxID=92897 RepID=A0AA39XUG0_9PEZI|nr:hypothetical protein B0T16DRAFT_248970 [Cercophora newfieldiana]
MAPPDDQKSCWELAQHLQISFHRSSRVADHPTRRPITSDTVLNRSSSLQLVPWKLSDGTTVYFIVLDFPRRNALKQLDGLAIQLQETYFSDYAFKVGINVQGHNVAGGDKRFFIYNEQSRKCHIAKSPPVWIDGMEVRPPSLGRPRLVRQFVASDSLERCIEQKEEVPEQSEQNMPGAIEVEVHAGFRVADDETLPSTAPDRDCGFTVFVMGLPEYCRYNGISCRINWPKTPISNLQSSDIVRDIKWRLAAIIGVGPDRQSLYYCSKLLETDRTLSDYDIQDGSTLYLLAKLRGGGFAPFKPQGLLTPIKIYRGGLIEQPCEPVPDGYRWGSVPVGKFTVYVIGPEIFREITGMPIPRNPTLKFMEFEARWAGSEDVDVEPGLAAESNDPDGFAFPIFPFPADRFRRGMADKPSSTGDGNVQGWLARLWQILRDWR